MKATRFEFRYRVAIIALIYLLGFLAPWERFASNGPASTAWLTLASFLAGSRWLTLSESTVFVTVFALVFAIAGMVLRVWGRAHLGAAARKSNGMGAAQLIASGPYRRLRTPRYLGTWMLAVPVALLMPVTGAIFLLAALFFFELRLIRGGEAHLAGKIEESYLSYGTQVSRLAPGSLSALPPDAAKPQWGRVLAAESYAVSFTLCFALLAWRYNAQLLTRCVLVCFGASLILNALAEPRRR